MPTRWRLLEHGAAHGAFNMGVDEALLASAVAGIATLRFYRWDGPWLSLGYAQKLDSRRLLDLDPQTPPQESRLTISILRGDKSIITPITLFAFTRRPFRDSHTSAANFAAVWVSFAAARA